MLEHTVRRTGDVTILDLSGRISLGEAVAFGASSATKLSDLIRSLAHEGHTRILLNLKKVTYIDSSGIGDLFGAYTSLRKLNGELKFLSPNKTVRDVLKLTRLDKFIDVKDDEMEAIRSFSKPAAG